MNAHRTTPRLVTVALVLAGLWFMHGISATTGAGCRGGAMPMIAVMTSGAAASGAPLEARATGPGAQANPADISAGPSGDLCLSGQPDDPGAALIALLALLAVTGYVRLAPAARLVPLARAARRWRAPPGRAGVALLTVVCVSRT